jgi:hypothetical protein
LCFYLTYKLIYILTCNNWFSTLSIVCKHAQGHPLETTGSVGAEERGLDILAELCEIATADLVEDADTGTSVNNTATARMVLNIIRTSKKTQTIGSTAFHP